MSKQYPNPPLVETIVDIVFEPGDPWTILVPGRMYDLIREDYPVIEPVHFGDEQVEDLAQRWSGVFLQRIHVLSEDRSRIVQLGPNQITLNFLRPYPGWTELLPIITRLIGHYLNVAKPKRISRMALRYVNQIDVPPPPAPIESLFEFRPFIGSVGNGEQSTPGLHAFLLGGDFEYDDDGPALRVQLVSGEPVQDGGAMYILDLDYRVTDDRPPSLQDFGAWLDKAHQRIEASFERIITATVRSIMNGSV